MPGCPDDRPEPLVEHVATEYISGMVSVGFLGLGIMVSIIESVYRVLVNRPPRPHRPDRRARPAPVTYSRVGRSRLSLSGTATPTRQDDAAQAVSHLHVQEGSCVRTFMRETRAVTRLATPTSMQVQT